MLNISTLTKILQVANQLDIIIPAHGLKRNSEFFSGTCAVLLTGNGHDRSLCANLAAANCFTKDHIDTPENRKLIEAAECYYITVLIHLTNYYFFMV